MEDWRKIINTGIAIVALMLTVTMVITLFLNRFDPVLTGLVIKNFPTIIGMPFSFIAAFVVVSLFRQGEGSLDFRGFGMEFKGASGEIILWLICFSVICGSIKLLWIS